MNLRKAIKNLSLIQLIGFTLVYLLISAYCFIEGRMMVFYIPIVGIMVIPFIIVSYSGYRFEKMSNSRIKKRIYMLLAILFIIALTLPSFFELGGFVILISLILFILMILYYRKDILKQLLLFNIVGLLLLSFLTFIIIYE